MTNQETFTTRLRRHRQRTRMSLAEIAAKTRVKEELLDALERNDLTDWPRGLYARSYVRAYATAIGLDPEYTVNEFCQLFPHGDRRARETMKEIAAIVASDSEWQDEFHNAEGDRRQSAAINLLPKRTWPEAAFGRATDALRSSWMWATREIRQLDPRRLKPARYR
jgi:branched-subunit amino acid aminotransferase/4-amino-4-deoxychorismate lyase